MTETDTHATSPRRLAIVLSHPVQHFSEAFALLSCEPGLDVEVMYWDRQEAGYTDEGFGREIVWDVDLTSSHPNWAPEAASALARARRSFEHLVARRPDAILCYGWSTPIARLTIATAVARRVPIIFYGDSTWQHSARPRLRPLRSLMLRWLFVRPTSHALSTGVFNHDFYLMHGMDADRVHEGVCPVDTRPFEAAFGTRVPSDGPVSIVFAGKLIERKGVADLIGATALLADQPTWHLTLVGDGPLRAKLERLVVEHGLTSSVSFSGFKNTSEMPAVFGAADILVVPSTLDMRVLVTTEAMAAGAVPVVSSATAVWGEGDLVEDGTTGRVYEVGDVEALASALQELISDPELRRRLSQVARRRALEHDSDDFARLAAAAVRKIDLAAPIPSARQRAVVRAKVAVADVITKPVVGRAVTWLTGTTIRVRGARIDATSPLVSDSTRAQLALRVYESAELRFVDRYLRSDLDVVELGSSIGVIGSVVLTKLDPGRRLAAVEADADLAEVARANFARNAAAKPWTLDVAAISYGSRDGLAFEKGSTSTAGRLIQSDGEDGDLPEFTTLSQLLERRGIDRYVLIADIEGAEEGIISDDDAALARCDQLIIELHRTDTMRVDEMRAALIERHGFSVTAEHGPVMVLDRR